MKDKLKQIFHAFMEYPGATMTAGIGRYVGWKLNGDRYGIVIYLGIFYLLVSFYDFHTSSAKVMADNRELRSENQLLNQMFKNRTPRKMRH